MAKHDNRPWKRWYSLARWERRRQALFAEHPLCIKCLAVEDVTEADTADHVIPHRGDPDLFWYGELQALCAACHSRDKQREELGQTVIRFDAAGWPI